MSYESISHSKALPSPDNSHVFCTTGHVPVGFGAPDPHKNPFKSLLSYADPLPPTGFSSKPLPEPYEDIEQDIVYRPQVEVHCLGIEEVRS